MDNELDMIAKLIRNRQQFCRLPFNLQKATKEAAKKGWLTRTGWDGQLIRCGENVEICPQEVYFVDPYYLGWT